MKHYKALFRKVFGRFPKHPRFVELEHRRRNVGSRNDVLLVLDGSLDNGGVVGVRDQADNEVVFGNLGSNGLVVGNVQRNRCRPRVSCSEPFAIFNPSAGCLSPRNAFIVE